MVIGVPRELKDGETRVGLTPSLVADCVRKGATVVVESGAGLQAGFTDEEFVRAGARLAPSGQAVWAEADLVVKVKEPQPSELALMREGQGLFTFLHLAANAELAAALHARRMRAVAYENVTGEDGGFLLLRPMSLIAGRLSTQIGAHFLESAHGGSGVLLGGAPGVEPGLVTVLGAGNAGTEACRMAVGLGARVTALDLDAGRLRALEATFSGAVRGVISTPDAVAESVAGADLVIGAVLVPGARAPVVAHADAVRRMRAGSVIVDIAIDQGGCVETVTPTSHHDPVRKVHGVLHYAVPNMPALVGRTATLALTRATETFVLAMAEHGLDGALAAMPGLARGLVDTDHT